MPEQGSLVRRLPLYGPLNIEDPQEFLERSKPMFDKCYNSLFPYVVSIKNFELLHILGKGAFGKVILVKFKLFKDSYYAMKAVSKKHLVQRKYVEHALNEKRILQSLNWPFCVRLEYFCHDNSYLYFFLPFVCGGEMFTHLQRAEVFPENVSRFYAAQVILGLEYLHYLGLVYRDLKPENLLIDHYGYLKITDFGFAKLVKSRTYTFCGTPDYIAPEVILGHGYRQAVDWWALGVLIFEMNSGQPPFVSHDHLHVFKNIINHQYSVPNTFSSDLQDIVRQLLQRDLSRRIGNLHGGVDDIKDHGWFRNINWFRLLNRTVAAPFVPPQSAIVTLDYFPDLQRCSSLKTVAENQYEEEFKDF